MNKFWVCALFLVCVPSTVYAAPGLDDVVYGATVETGKSEIETRYGRLTGGPADGEDALVIEASHTFTPRIYGAVLATFGHEPGSSRRLETIALEGIYALGRINGLDLDTAVYVEVAHGLHGPDNFEAKLLLERRKGPFDTRLNLRAERPWASGAPIEFGYAASADYKVADDVSLGAEAFGDFGTSHGLTTRGEHFIGPAAKIELDHAGPGELEVRAGYLIPVDRARDDTKGQLRLGIEYEF